MTPDATDALSTVKAYHHAWTSGDVDRALTYVSDGVRCFAPDDSVTTKDDWRAYLTGFVPLLTEAPELTHMTDGTRVALWYFPQTAVTTTLASELFTVREGRSLRSVSSSTASATSRSGNRHDHLGHLAAGRHPLPHEAPPSEHLNRLSPPCAPASWPR